MNGFRNLAWLGRNLTKLNLHDRRAVWQFDDLQDVQLAGLAHVESVEALKKVQAARPDDPVP